MSSFFHCPHLYSAATSALKALLHHRHALTSPRNSDSGARAAPAPPFRSASQNGTGFGNLTITNVTMLDAVRGGLNGTSTSPETLQRLNSRNYGPQINFTIWLLTALSAIFLALRVYCKFLRHRGLWWDDHILIASWVRTLQAYDSRSPSYQHD
jgi:hypothetical protein